MKVLLDTDITSYLFGRRDEQVRRRFTTFAVGEVGISAITAAELMFGAERSGSERNMRSVERALASLTVASFDAAAARIYGRIRTVLQRRGMPIGPLDMLIAAHAVALNVPLVTNNVREFHRVPDLRVENWVR